MECGFLSILTGTGRPPLACRANNKMDAATSPTGSKAARRKPLAHGASLHVVYGRQHSRLREAQR